MSVQVVCIQSLYFFSYLLLVLSKHQITQVRNVRIAACVVIFFFKKNLEIVEIRETTRLHFVLNPLRDVVYTCKCRLNTTSLKLKELQIESNEIAKNTFLSRMPLSLYNNFI